MGPLHHLERGQLLSLLAKPQGPIAAGGLGMLKHLGQQQQESTL